MYIPEGSAGKPYSGFFSAPVISVGWLGDKKDPIPQGACPPEFLEVLKSAKRVLLCRGFHVCELCEVDKASGNGEIWARTTDGVYYAMPDMVVHYIEAHGYCPPQHLVDNFERLVDEDEINSLRRQATPEEQLEISRRHKEQNDLRVMFFAQQIADAEDARILKEIGILFGKSPPMIPVRLKGNGVLIHNFEEYHEFFLRRHPHLKDIPPGEKWECIGRPTSYPCVISSIQGGNDRGFNDVEYVIIHIRDEVTSILKSALLS